MRVVGEVLGIASYLFLLLLFARLVIGYVVSLAGVRPQGRWAVACEVAYATTDVTVRPLDRALPKIRLGRYVLPMGLLVSFIGVGVLIQVADGLR